MADGYRITPGPLQRSVQPSRSSSKQGLAASRSGGSRTSVAGVAMREGPLRPPPGFVSYQIPNGAVVPAAAPPPSDNIHMNDARRFMSVGSLMGSRPMTAAGHQYHHHQHQNGGQSSRYTRQNSGGGGSGRCGAEAVYITAREPMPPLLTAGIYPSHLHNGGRPHSSSNYSNNGASNHWPSPPSLVTEDTIQGGGYWGQENSRQPPPDFYQPPPWAGDRLVESASSFDTPVASSAPRRYPRSPLPGRQPATRSLQHATKNLSLSEDPRRRPPLPGAAQGVPRPPPRSRPRSWTSTLFNAMRNGTSLSKKNGGNNSTTLPYGQEGGEEEEAEDGGVVALADGRDEDNHQNYYYGGQQYTSTTPGALRDYNTGTLEKRGGHQSKQVRFLANPSKPAESGLPRFYSLPRFILPGSASSGELRERGGGRRPSQQLTSGEPAAKIKMRSRTPSPFGRFVKSLVRGELKQIL